MFNPSTTGSLKKSTYNNIQFYVRFLLPWMILGISLAITIQGYKYVHSMQEKHARERFGYETQDASQKVFRRLHEYEMALRGGVGLFQASHTVTRLAWRDYVAALRIDQYYPGIQGIGFSQIIQPRDKEAHERSIRAEGFPEYSIRPAGERDLYSAIIYLEPFTDRNLRAFGYDMYSEPVRHIALEKAAKTGEPSVTQKIKLVQETDKDVQAGFLMYLPLYRSDRIASTDQERWDALIGFVYAPFRVKDFLRGVLGDGVQKLDFCLYDSEVMTPEHLMHDSREATQFAGNNGRFTTKERIQVPGGFWSIEFFSRPVFDEEMLISTPEMVLIGGISLSFLLFLLLMSQALEHRRVMHKAREMTSELRVFSAAVEQSPVSVVITDLGGNIVYGNESMQRVTGYRLDEVIGRNASIFQSGETSVETYQKLWETIQAGNYWTADLRNRRKNGELYWERVKIAPIQDDGNVTTHYLGLKEDISEMRRISDALQESQTTLQSILDNSPSLIFLKDNTGRYLFVNKPWSELLSCDLDRCKGRMDLDIFPEDMARIFMKNDQHVLFSEKVVEFEHEVPHPDGIHIYLFTKFPLRDAESKAYAVGGIAVDVTERKLAEHFLTESENRFRALMEQSPFSIMVMSPKGDIQAVNPAWEKLWGLKLCMLESANVLNVSMFSFLDMQHFFVRALSGEYCEIPPALFTAPSVAKACWIRGFLYPIRDTTGEIQEIIFMQEDVTERKEAEDALHKTNLELQASIAKISQHDQEMVLINQLDELLQNCLSVEEACRIVSVQMSKLFPKRNGIFARLTTYPSLEVISRWGEDSDVLNHFEINNCWALRRGVLHLVVDPANEVCCMHYQQTLNHPTVCLPLSVQGELIGLIELDLFAGEDSDYIQRLLVSIGEVIKLAFSNIELRSRLLEQATHDPLTGLFNRRYLNETLPRELNRAKRLQSSLCLAMFDLDKFKSFNDTYGHDTGDIVLCQIARLLMDFSRKSDIACRFGGEELILVLPDSSLEDASVRLDELRQKAKMLVIRHGSNDLPPVTLSIGLAAYNYNEINHPEELIRRADTALYEAKHNGRDQLVVYKG